MTHARRQFMLFAACLGVTVLAGCAVGAAQPAVGGQASSVTSQPPSPASAAASPQDVNVAAFHALAKQEATTWPQSPLGKVWQTGLVVPVADDLSSGPSGGFPSSETKIAFGNGNLVFTGPRPSGVPAGVVTWPDGSSMKVPVLSETQAFTALKNNTGGKCPSCVTTTLAVTAAKPTTMQVPTSRGTASVPAWAFTLQGVSTPVIQAALPAGSYVTEYSSRQPAEQLGPLGQGFVGAVAATPAAGGRTLTLMLEGSPCDTTWGGLVTEVGDVVVAGGWMHDAHPAAPCAASLVGRTVTVRLAKPLGDRVVLDAATGLPTSQVPLFAKPVPK